MRITFSIIACALLACCAIQSPQAGPVGFRLSSAAFSPDSISGLILWLDASRITGLTNGESVTTWTDLTGNGWNATQGTASAKPTYQVAGGLPVVQTDGVNDWLATTGPDLRTTTYTVVGASRWVVANTGRTFSGHGSGVNWLMGHWTSYTENYYANGGWVAGPTGTSDTNWRIYAATGNYTNDSWAMYVNGVLTAGPNSNGFNGPGNFYLGSSLGIGEFGSAQFSFMFVYNRVLTDAEIRTIYNGMRGRFGL